MTELRVHTTAPVNLYVTIGRGRGHVRVVTTDTAETHVVIERRAAHRDPRPGARRAVPQNDHLSLGSFLTLCASLGLPPGGVRPM